MIEIFSHGFRSKLIKIFWITIFWTAISLFNHFNVGVALDFIGCDLESGETLTFFNASLLTGISAGILGGSFIVFLWEKWLRKLSYLRALFYIFISYSGLYIIVSLFGAIFFYYNTMELETTDAKSLTKTVGMQFTDIVSYLFWLCIVLGTLFFLQVNDKYGPGTIYAFLKGKYFHPRKEVRIFMILDLRGSTSIAEKLEEERYFRFLKDVYYHITLPILNARGEIYQYVGDEIVITWPLKSGLAQHRCINCFSNVQWTLRNKAEYYKKTYGVQPEFKAALHYGPVIAGEIGVVKRDITFSGDVLNTTSRIQEKCNEFGVNVLISKGLIEKLDLRSRVYVPKEIGNIFLRGKQDRMILFTV